MLVSINSLIRGTCVWCCQTSEDAIDASFKDLKGVFCKRHFFEALKARAEKQVDEQKPPVKVSQAQ